MAELAPRTDLSCSDKGLRAMLIVDEHDSSRLLTKWFLSNFGYTVHSARSATEAIALFDPEIHDLVITDARPSEDQRVDTAQFVKSRSPATPVVIFSSNPPPNHACFDAFVARPGHLLLLKEAVDAIVASRAGRP